MVERFADAGLDEQSPAEVFTNMGDILKDVLLWMVSDALPTNADREFARIRQEEMSESIAFDVLYAQLDESVAGLDRDFVGAFLLELYETVSELESPSSHLNAINQARRVLMNDPTNPGPVGLSLVSPMSILSGEHGRSAQLSFLAGAMYAAELFVGAEIMERSLTTD